MCTPGDRYLGAWQEVTARIQARDNAVIVFITLAAALTGASLTDSDISVVGLLVGFAALPSVLLSRHHDLVIGYLNRYQLKVSLETEPDPNKPCPEWFASEHFRDAMHQRTGRDWAFAMFIAVCSSIGLVRVVLSHQWIHCYVRLVWVLSVAGCISSLGVIVATARQRRRISEEMVRLEAEKKAERQRSSRVQVALGDTPT